MGIKVSCPHVKIPLVSYRQGRKAGSMVVQYSTSMPPTGKNEYWYTVSTVPSLR